MLIRLSGPAPVRCRVCGYEGAGELVAEFPISNRPAGTAVRCLECDTIELVDDLLDFSPTDELVEDYVESSAGVGTIIGFIADVERPHARYLDVGCNYGFSLDFARWRYGWEVTGVEPSLAGVRGAEELGLDIRNEYLGAGSEIGGPFDVMLCSEVLEHVPDPRAFLRELYLRLDDDGVLILTTPDADASRNGSSDATVLSTFSAGFHHFITTAASLEKMMRDVGFGAVRVTSIGGASLRAAARRTPGPLPDPNRNDEEVTRLIDRYLSERSETLEPASPAAVGLVTRAFRDAVARGDWAQAERRRPRVRAVMLARHGIDIEDPRAVQEALDRGVNSSGLPLLCGALGMYELLSRSDPRRAADYFALVEHATGGRDPDEIGVHLEFAEAIDLARYHRLLALARIGDPELEYAISGYRAGFGDPASRERLTLLRGLRVLVEAVVHGHTEQGSALLLPMHEVVSAVYSEDAELARAGRDALYASAAVLTRKSRRREAAAYISLGRAVLQGPGDEGIASLLESVASELASLTPAVADVSYAVEAFWSDTQGTFLAGWAHRGGEPISDLALEVNDRAVGITAVDRPDLASFWPDSPRVARAGFQAYIPGRLAADPIMRGVTAEGIPIESTIRLPSHALPRHPLEVFEPEPQLRALVDAAPPGPVLLIGARSVAAQHSPFIRSVLGDREIVGLDIHPGSNVEIVGDAHRFSSLVPPGRYPVVASWSVFEHLTTPWLAAAEIARVLPLGGVTLHYAPWLWPTHAAPADYWRMSAEGLNQLFAPELGFTVRGSGGLQPALVHPLNPEVSDLRMPTTTSMRTSWIIAEKVAEPVAGATWPYDAERAAFSERYPVDGILDMEGWNA